MNQNDLIQDPNGFNLKLHRGGALSLFGIVCLITCFLVGLSAVCLLLFSLI